MINIVVHFFFSNFTNCFLYILFKSLIEALWGVLEPPLLYDTFEFTKHELDGIVLRTTNGRIHIFGTGHIQIVSDLLASMDGEVIHVDYVTTFQVCL